MVACISSGASAWCGDLDVVINEVLYHPPSSLDNAEYIELHNRGAVPVDVSGWKLTRGVAFTIPGGVSIAAGGYLLVVKSTAQAAVLYPGVARVGNYTGDLSDGGERLRLETGGGVLVDEFDYFDDDGWPRGADGTGASLEKRSPELTPWFADSWASSLTLLGSPGKLNTQFREDVAMSFIVAGEDWRYFKGTAEPSGGTDDWADPTFSDATWLEGPAGFGYGDNDDATILDDMLNGYTTFYVRKAFSVANPQNVLSLALSIDYDDGFVAYLNGAEVARRNVGGTPGTPLGVGAVALGNHEAGTPEVIDITVDIGLLQTGTNVLAIHSVNQSLASTDASLHPTLSGLVQVSGVDESLTRLSSTAVIPLSSIWSYFKGTAEPSVTLGDWAQPGFDGSSWPTGPAGFGFSDGDDATILADMQNGYSTLYVRKAFNVASLAEVTGMSVGVNYDDGFIAYLNGVEVARASAPGAVGVFQPHTALSSGSHEAGVELLVDLTSRISLLVEGENVLALQGFNAALSNQDFSLHPRLSLVRAVAGDPAALKEGISINEVYVPGAGAGWVELHNACPVPVDLSGYGLSDDPIHPLRYALAPGSLIPAGGYLVVDEADLGFSLPAAGTLLLTDAVGVVLVDGRSHATPDPLLSAGAYPDGDTTAQVLSSPTRGASNAPPPDFGVVINELQYHPLAPAGAVESEWIELHNTTGSVVDLTGWRFTRGISFAFSAGTTIPAGGYRVVARDPAAVATKYGIVGVVGGYTSGLRNDDEVVVLRDHLGNVADRVHYADDGRWPSAADGAGPSAELVSPALDNSHGQAWAASTGEGTPGAQNSAFSTSHPPVVSRVRHFPLVPRSTQSVQVTADVEGLATIFEVRLFHRVAGAGAFAETLLLDDGLSGDGAAGDGVHGGTLPAQPDGTVVEFFIEAEDAVGQIRLVPETAPARCNLYLVDDPPSGLGAPAYRVVMTPADRTELQTRNVNSNVLLNATFISGNDVYYQVGLRYRGESSRLVTPKSYRIDFTDDEEFEGLKRLNLNGNKAQHQHLGMELFRAASVPTPMTRPVLLLLGTDTPTSYTRMEEVDEDFLRRFYVAPDGEDEGDLYRGIDTGDLDYRGTDKESYRPSYAKETNQELDDWASLIDLCDKLTDTPTVDLPAVLPTIIDTDEWARFFAVHTLISTQEGGIYRDKGDDYFLYRRPSDGRWVLIPWDLDDSFAQPSERLFRPTLPAVSRFLQNPEWSNRYYFYLAQLSSSHFSIERMTERVSLLADLYPPATLGNDLAFIQSRLQFVDGNVNQDFTTEVSGLTPVPAGASWRFFRGVSEPSGGTLQWTERGFPDGAWETGPSGFGYGDGDDATVLGDMLNTYSTVYARHAFTIADPGALASLELSIDYDDGFIAFLNGAEIARSNAGPNGSYPAFDGLATASREAGVAQVFRIQNASSLLVAGTNVLAVVGLNQTLASTDFSLIPELRSGGVVGEACPGDEYVTGELVFFSGLAPVTLTRHVRVNGLDAAYDHFTGAWSIPVSLASGSQVVTVQLLSSSLQVLGTETRTLQRVSTLGGTLTADTILGAAESPYLVTGSLTIASGAHVTIEAGTDLLLLDGINIRVDGQLQALGTASGPITFTRVPCHENWGFLTFASQLDNQLLFCELSRSTASPGCISGGGINLLIDHCHIHDVTGEGVSINGSTITVRNTIVERTNEALSLDASRTIVEFCTLRNVIGKSDLCDTNGSNNPPARVAFNDMHHTSDDAIDVDNGGVFAEGNLMHNCGDQGISLVGAGNSTVYRNISYRNSVGLSSKDSHVALVDFNTFFGNTNVGVRAIEKTAGRGGGIITLKNSIVWGNNSGLFINSTGVITSTYSDVQGTLVPGVGNLNVDPLFVNAAGNDYHLQATSPCIGAAENGDDMGALPFEITPRAPSDLAVSGTTAGSISLTWKDNSTVEAAMELHRRVSAGFIPTYLVEEGDSWRYLKGQSEPSGGTLDWTATTFDAAAWALGPSGIGYGDGDDATILGDMQNAYTTVYMRHTFNVPDASGITRLELIMDFDDGFVAFLNGVEIARQGAGNPGTFLPFNGLATVDHEAGIPIAVELDVLGLLVSGDNVLAVQGLNIAASSSDLTMIPELRTVDEGPFTLHATLPPNSREYRDLDIDAVATYSYKVRAVNPSGPSAFSNVVSVVAGTLPSAPTSLAVTFFTTDTIGLSWADNAANETSYELERSVGSGEFSLLVSLPADSEAHVDTPLMEGETYSYRVRARNAFGPSAYSNTVTQVPGTVPDAPSGLAVTDVTIDTIGLTWTDNSSNETAFEVEVSVGGGIFQARGSVVAGVVVFTDDELLPGEAYTYRVRAVNAVGASGYSNEATATTGSFPATPADLSVIATGLDFLTLAWGDASTNETGFELERRATGEADFSIVVLLSAGATQHQDTGLPSGATFTYRVRALGDFGPSPYSNLATGTTGRLPAAPTGLAIGSVTLDSISLLWSENADNETGLELERSDDGGPFLKVADLPPNTGSALDGGLLSGTLYSYRVRTVNSYGASVYAGPASAETGRLPAPPSDLTLLFRGHDSARFSWSDNSDNEVNFEVERSDVGGPFVKIAELSQDAVEYNDAGLAQGAAYDYRVRAVNSFGVSAYSDVLSVVTGQFPQTPTDLIATADGLSTVQLSWVHTGPNETGFEVERKTGAGAFLKVADLPADSTDFTDTGLDEGTQYTYRVRAVNDFGASDYSNEAVTKTAVRPAAPVELAVTDAGIDFVSLEWVDASDNEATFELERSIEGAPFELAADLAADTTSYTDLDLPPATEVSYRVRAVNGFGASGYAGPVTTRTLSGAPALSSIVPNEGPATGGTSVVIEGESFLPGAAVALGGAPLEDLVIVSATRIEGTVPAGVRGAADVVLTTSQGTATLPDGFHYFDLLLRGNVNGDIKLDISDPVYLLNYLFVGGPAIPCNDVGDANADARVDLSDAVYVLLFLFSGGEPIDPVEARCD